MGAIDLARYLWPDAAEGRLPQISTSVSPDWKGLGLEAYWSATNPLFNIASGVGVNAASVNGLANVLSQCGLAVSGFSSPGSSNHLVRFNDVSGFTAGQEKTLFCAGTINNYYDTSVLVSIGTAGQGIKLSTNYGNWTITYFGVADYSFGIAPVSYAPFTVACSIKGSTATLVLFQKGALKTKSISVGTPVTTTVPLVIGSVGSSAATDVCTGSIAAGGSFNKALSLSEMVALVTGGLGQLVAPPLDLPFYLSVGGAQSFSYSATGGMQLGGASALIRGSVPAPSGGMQLGGSSAEARGKIAILGGGGAILGGAATQVRGRAIDASGGTILGGAASIVRSAIKAATGGLQLGGAASVSFTSAVQSRVVNAVGGMILAGAAGVQRTVTASLTASGLLFGGSAGAYIGGQIGNWLQLARRRGNR